MKKYFEKHLQNLQDKGRTRGLKPLSNRVGCKIDYQGQRLINLSSNDYLGLAGDENLHNEFFRQMKQVSILNEFGLGAASSRLLTGDNLVSHELEAELQKSYQKEACLLFNSGYHANIGIMPALMDKNDLILSDKLNHASITDGLQLSRSKYKRFHHCDYDHLEWLLDNHRQDHKKVVIASESVFSMDGDIADLEKLVHLKNKYDALLYIDEAHAIGLYGSGGLGIAEEQGQLDQVDLLVGTFGKAPASIGAFVLCSDLLKTFLLNTSRSLIFTTALPPIIMNWNLFVFRKILGLEQKRQHLINLSSQLRKELVLHGLKTAGTTNIVPVMLGDDSLAVDLAEKMQKEGYLIFPVRPPTVPEGSSRFRLSLTADMQWDDLQEIAPLVSQMLSGSSARQNS